MEKTNENMLKYLEFLQNIITRMNTNSFQIKTFAITIASAIIAFFYNKNYDKSALVFYIAMILIFWILDASYLRMERAYRDIYNDVIKGEKYELFNLSAKERLKNSKFNYCCIIFSWSLAPLYLCLIIMVLISLVFA